MKFNKIPEPSEHDQQCSIFRFAELMEKQYPELEWLRGSMNGVRLTIGQAVKAKRAGMKKGYPDISLDVARGGYNGLRIELKKKTGTVSPEQKKWILWLSEQGYFAIVCRGEDEAKQVLINYLRGEIKNG
jgi:hypothetical protein